MKHEPTLEDLLLWSCPWCGLETSTPGKHLETHGVTLEEVLEGLDRMAAARRDMERLLLLHVEVPTCPTCDRPLPRHPHNREGDRP